MELHESIYVHVFIDTEYDDNYILNIQHGELWAEGGGGVIEAIRGGQKFYFKDFNSNLKRQYRYYLYSYLKPYIIMASFGHCSYVYKNLTFSLLQNK